MSTAKRLRSFTAAPISRSKSTCTTSTVGVLDCESDVATPMTANKKRGTARSEARRRFPWLNIFFSLYARHATAAHQHDKPDCIIRATLIDVRNDLPYDMLELSGYVFSVIARALIAACDLGTGNAKVATPALPTCPRFSCRFGRNQLGVTGCVTFYPLRKRLNGWAFGD